MRDSETWISNILCKVFFSSETSDEVNLLLFMNRQILFERKPPQVEKFVYLVIEASVIDMCVRILTPLEKLVDSEKFDTMWLADRYLELLRRYKRNGQSSYFWKAARINYRQHPETVFWFWENRWNYSKWRFGTAHVFYPLENLVAFSWM